MLEETKILLLDGEKGHLKRGGDRTLPKMQRLNEKGFGSFKPEYLRRG